MKKVVLFFALIVGLLASASTLQAQTVNMSRYITLTVAKDSAIKLDFWAAQNTTVRIVSGSYTQDITVGTYWYDGNVISTFAVIADSTTMTVYGDIVRFNCNYNGANLTAIDLSHNTQLISLDCSSNSLTALDVSHDTQLNWLDCSFNSLTALDLSNNTQLMELKCSANRLTSLDVSKHTQLSILYCQGNNFSTAALDDIYCSLPDKTGTFYGELYLLNNASDPNYATVIASNAQNAIAKNWKVWYSSDYTEISATTGTYTCPQLNMDSYITLTVAKDSAIKLDFKAATNVTPVRIKSGITDTTITVGTSWKGITSYTAADSVMTIYGDLTGFDCSRNGADLTAIDLSHNTELAVLNLFYNQLTSLDLSHNTKLTGLNCSYNQLLTLDISHNTRLTTLDCSSNLLSSLNVDSNRLLAELNCSYNRIPSLDISHNTQLGKLACYGNSFTRQVLDDIFCLLPDRSGIDAGTIEPLYDVASSEFATVVATNKSNATNKNWKVRFSRHDADVPTTGKHKCSATDIADATAEQALTLYPNPVADVLYLSATARTIRIYNVYGIEVAHATDTDRVEVAHLPAGIYTVKADGTVAKMVKR